MIQLGWDPLGVNGDSWLKSARSVLLELESSTGVTLSLSGVAADSMDAIDSVYQEFPLMIEITCGVVLVFVALAFRSIFIPLR